MGGTEPDVLDNGRNGDARLVSGRKSDIEGMVTLQAWGQQRVDTMRSAIVFGLEPVFAAFTAWFLLGESLGWAGLAGASLVVAGLVFSQVDPPTRIGIPD